MIEYEALKNSNRPYHGDLIKKFKEVLEKGWYILGEETRLFEERFANYHKVPYCCGVASGTDAIFLALKCLNLNHGSEVIVSGYTYIATILPIIQCGYIPVLVDPCIQTYNIDPANIREAITSNTRAILVTHMHGKVCEMDSIVKIAQDNDLFLIEDCAQSHGAMFNKKKAGTFGDFGCFSFYPTKNLGALGDAGAILCHREDLHERLKILRNNGSDRKYHNKLMGYNSRLDELQAAFLNIKLADLDNYIAHKKRLAEVYFEDLLDKFVLPRRELGFDDSYHIFSIRHDRRDDIKRYLLEKNIKTEVHYPIPPYRQEVWIELKQQPYSLPVADKIHDTTLSLPISRGTSVDDVQEVCRALNQFR